MNRRTPLYERHRTAGGKMIPFAGWEMPVQYIGILEEHRIVREACGIFDISHMGEFFFRGAQAAEFLERLLTNRIAKLSVGEAQYSLMLNECGGVIDDLIVYRIAGDEFLLIVNAAMIDKDEAWIRSHSAGEILWENRSDMYAALAVQGPQAPEVFRKCFGKNLPAARNRVIPLSSPYSFAVTTGYTGEAGFEMIIPAQDVITYWDACLAAGCKPCGLGARDILRLEMGYPLNGSDLLPNRTPLEAGLGTFVDLEKGEFIGRDVLLRQKTEGLKSFLAAFRGEEKSPPLRSHYPVLAQGKILGETTSGAFSPSLGCSIGLAYIPFLLAKEGQSLEIEIRSRRYKAVVVKKPFYQSQS